MMMDMKDIVARLNCLIRYDDSLGTGLVRNEYGDYVDINSIADALYLDLDKGGVGFSEKEFR